VSVNLPGRGGGGGITTPTSAMNENSKMGASNSLSKEADGFFRALSGRGKEKDKLATPSNSSPSATTVLGPPTSAAATSSLSTTTRHTNVFLLVERFTFRLSSTETEMANPPPRLPPEIQYWAGVIMRNACRKDESRGGIRQCANSASHVFFCFYFVQ
jgi:hypothetical protein